MLSNMQISSKQTEVHGSNVGWIVFQSFATILLQVSVLFVLNYFHPDRAGWCSSLVFDVNPVCAACLSPRLPPKRLLRSLSPYRRTSRSAWWTPAPPCTPTGWRLLPLRSDITWRPWCCTFSERSERLRQPHESLQPVGPTFTLFCTEPRPTGRWSPVYLLLPLLVLGHAF